MEMSTMDSLNGCAHHRETTDQHHNGIDAPAPGHDITIDGHGKKTSAGRRLLKWTQVRNFKPKLIDLSSSIVYLPFSLLV